MQPTRSSPPNQTSNPKPGAPTEADAWKLEDHWQELVSALADQFTEGVSSLQNQIDQLLAKGRITKMEHRALNIPAERIKLAGLSAQQIHRLYGGRIRQTHEKVNMADLVEGVLQERKQELGILGIALRRKLKPVEVLIDPTLAHSFVNAVLDWGIPFGNRVDVRMDLNAWPQHARLQMRVANDGIPPSSSTASDSLSWMLIRQIAAASGGIDLERDVTAEGVSFTAMFSRTVVQAVDGISTVDLSDEHIVDVQVALGHVCAHDLP